MEIPLTGLKFGALVGDSPAGNGGERCYSYSGGLWDLQNEKSYCRRRNNNTYDSIPASAGISSCCLGDDECVRFPCGEIGDSTKSMEYRGFVIYAAACGACVDMKPYRPPRG